LQQQCSQRTTSRAKSALSLTSVLDVSRDLRCTAHPDSDRLRRVATEISTTTNSPSDQGPGRRVSCLQSLAFSHLKYFRADNGRHIFTERRSPLPTIAASQVHRRFPA